MITFKCPSCGGEMSVSVSGDLQCSYCRRKTVFTDKDLREYKDYRYRMLSYLSTISNRADSAETEKIWQNAEVQTFRIDDGRPLTIRYLFVGELDGIVIYTARKNVIFVFPPDMSTRADSFIKVVNSLSYPSADIKGLAKYFPAVSGRFLLDDGRTILSVSKDEEFFPLAAFGSLPAVHAAWIVSRLENLCCVLAYSGIYHAGISLESVFINARTHEACLLGGWWNSSLCSGGSQKDLVDLRALAKRLTGSDFESSPEEFRKFIDSPPAEDAFDDFVRWDEVIKTGFGGRKFVRLDLSNLQI